MTGSRNLRRDFQARAFRVCFRCAMLAWLAGAATPAVIAQRHEQQSSAQAQDAGPPVMDNRVFARVVLHQFEGRTNAGEFRWDGEGWVGTDFNKLWVKSEGFAGPSGVTDGDQEALYDRPIPHMRYFDAQAGVRADLDSGPARGWAAVGIEGMAPYFAELAPTLYVGSGGRIAGRVEGFDDLLLTQRWIVQPEAELNFYSKDDPGRATGSGFSSVDAGVRLRYEISRKFGPYVGFAYHGQYGDTAAYARQGDEITGDPCFVFGLRFWR